MTWIGVFFALWVHAGGSFGASAPCESATVAAWDAQTRQFVAPSEKARETLLHATRVAPEVAEQVVEESTPGSAGGYRVRLKGAVARSAFVAAIEPSGEVGIACEGGAPLSTGELELREGSSAADRSGEEQSR